MNWRIVPYGGRTEDGGYKLQRRMFFMWVTFACYDEFDDADLNLGRALDGAFNAATKKA